MEKQKLSVRIDEVERKINELDRKMSSLQKSLDLIYEDRSLLSEMQGSLAHLKEIILTEHEHQEIIAKSTKEDVADVKRKVEEKAEDVKDTIDNSGAAVIKGVADMVVEKPGIVKKVLGKKN